MRQVTLKEIVAGTISNGCERYEYHCIWVGLNQQSKAMKSSILLVLLVLLPLYSEATDCTGLPSNETIILRLQNLVDSEGGEGQQTIAVQDGPFYTCLVQGTTMGTYQELSVIMTYTVPTSSDTSVRVSQIEMDCTDIGGGTRL